MHGQIWRLLDVQLQRKSLVALTDLGNYNLRMGKKQRQLGNFHYVGIALATVLFWRAIWNILDRLTAQQDGYIADILTGSLGLLLLWYLTRTLKHLD